MGKVYVFDHPLIQHKTALMRKTDTSQRRKTQRKLIHTPWAGRRRRQAVRNEIGERLVAVYRSSL